MQPPEPGSELLDVVSTTHQKAGCDQCYEYVGTDAWKMQPPFMTSEAMHAGLERIREHADTHGISDVRIIAHGGEPLMASDAYIDTFYTAARKILDAPSRNVHLGLQTNGLLLTDRKLDILLRNQVAVGLSIDGNKEANDRHRLDRLGKSTYQRAVTAAGKLAASGIKWGILSVIDVANDPEETLESLASLQPQSISLFPAHTNWSAPPARNTQAMTLGEWQTRVFERYRDWHIHHPEQPRPPFTLPLAEGYIEAFLGAIPLHERISNRYPHELFILPNGQYQRLDTLKSTEPGSYKTAYTVFDHSIDKLAANDPGFAARRLKDAALAKECLACPVFDACGGDYYPLRYKRAGRSLTPESTSHDFHTAFRNRSINCADQKEYLGNIALFVAQQRDLLEAPKAVNIAATWRASRHDTTGYLQNNPGHFVGNNIDTITFDQIEPLMEQLRDDQFSGKQALHILKAIAKQTRPSQVLYFKPTAHRSMRAEEFTAVQDVTDSINQAIVQSLFQREHMFLRDTPFALRRCGNYWLVTKDAVEAHARYARIPSNAYVAVVPLSRRTHLELKSGRLSPDDELEISLQASNTHPVRIWFRDAPEDLLIVSHQKNTALHNMEALEEISARLPLYESAELLSSALMQENSELRLDPLSGKWPMAAELQKHQSLYAF